MTDIRATFDGHRVTPPPDPTGQGSGSVIVLFADGHDADQALWEAAQEPALAKVWDNADDAIYDEM